ncbi:MAG: VanZ family protein [Calditrichaeota bacterium]|nr:MAG: VanZ family protein [Calditrichota bacterium]
MSQRIHAWAAYLTLCYAAFIVYVALYPFQFNLTWVNLQARWHQVDWVPFFTTGGFAPRADLVLNILLFIPLGASIALWTSLQGSDRFVRHLVLATLTGLGLSILVESVQVLTVNRFPSVNDLITNTLGSGLGFFLFNLVKAALPSPAHRWIRRQLPRPEFRFLVVLGLVILVFQFYPYHFSLRWSLVARRLGVFFSLQPVVYHLANGFIFLYLLVGSVFASYLLRIASTNWESRRLHRLQLSLLMLAFAGFAFLEICQLFIPARQPVFVDLIAFAAGLTVTAMAAPRVVHPGQILLYDREALARYRNLLVERHWLRFLFGLYLLLVCLQVVVWFLSTGQQSRVQLAALLAVSPKMPPLQVVGLFMPLGFAAGLWVNHVARRGPVLLARWPIISFSSGIFIFALGLLIFNLDWFTMPLTGVLAGLFLQSLHHAIFFVEQDEAD